MSKIMQFTAIYVVFWVLVVAGFIWAFLSIDWAHEMGNFIKEVREASE